MENSEIAILGAGMSGLSLGTELSRRGIPFTVYEAEAAPGGLCRTWRTGPFHWDLGVHALYSKDKAFQDFLTGLPLRYKSCDRTVKICHLANDDVYELDYPFENGLYQLPDDDWEDCIVGYMESCASKTNSFKNLKDWIHRGLGSGIARCFMIPYNTKIWNARLDDISLGLVSNKIEPEPFEKILKGALGHRFIGRAYQSKFLYPHNGIQALVDTLHAPISRFVRLDKALRRIIPQANGYILEFADATRATCRKIISTIPLPTLIDALPYPELAVRRDRLRHNDTFFIMIGLKDGKSFGRFKSCHWVFFAGDEMFYRLTFMENFSDGFCPAVVAEYTVKTDEAVSRDALVETVVSDLMRRGILGSADDIACIDTHFQRYTYPIPTVGLDDVKAYLTEFLAAKDIYLVGRNGAWEYLNIDGVFASAARFVAALPHRG